MLRSVSGSNSSRGIAAVVGVGPRLGSAVARKFASEGYTIAILSRDLGTSLASSSSLLFRAARRRRLLSAPVWITSK
jgi:predicted dinucleotide-binding enzyme